MEIVRKVLDSKAFWLGAAAVAGAFGEHYANAINSLGAVVMLAL